MPKKLALGDIFEIQTSKGPAYIQCVKSHKTDGEILKVFNRIYTEKPQDLITALAEADHYFVGFPLRYAWHRKIVEKAGHAPLPENFTVPRYARTKHIVRDEFLGWFIVDRETLKLTLVKELAVEQKKLSPNGIINDTLLIEWLESGWSPETWE